jgi:NADH-quinone oxidoreductase subunit G
LQDLAVGYGGSESKYSEDKRVVANKNLGPLISTDMTRCIHCTRCVRFGQEIAGIMELGMIGRGEHSEIITFVGKTVDSELSGNAIDLCPVGALTSKPFRYSARTWELTRKASISPHCGLGSNLTLQIKQNRVMRALPRENEAVNECWISDKDRFSYEGLNSSQRLTRPMVKSGGQWQEVDWQTALEAVVAGLKKAGGANIGGNVGALATPHQTVEELYLLQKLMRGLGSNNIDFRLRQSDFSADGKLAGVPWLGLSIADIPQLDRVLVIGSTLRKDHPLIAHRLRQASKKSLKINILHSVDDDLLMRVANRSIVAPASLLAELAGIVKAAAAAKNVAAPAAVANATVSEAAQRIAASLCDGKSAAVCLGNFAQHHVQAAQLHALAQALAEITGAKLGVLGEAANSVGGHVVNALPSASGKNARDMLAQPMKAYVLLGVEPELDTQDPRAALAAMKQAEFVVAMSAFQHKAVDYANVLLPIAPFTETAGTFVNTEGRAQTFQGVVQPLGETRPAWKVLRVLGNLLNLPGFDQQSAEEVCLEALGADNKKIIKNNKLNIDIAAIGATPASGIQRIAETPIYAADALVRRAPSLQKTRDGAAPMASMNRALADKLGLRDGDSVRVVQGGGVAEVGYAIDDKLPADCLRLAAAREETSGLGAPDAPLTLERIAGQSNVQQRVAV